MTRDEQLIFVEQLIGNIKDDVLSNILMNKVPSDWEGFELRLYLADKFTDAVMVKLPPKRKRAYKNTVLVNNL